MTRRLRLLLLRWHRRLGVLVALVILMLVVTGIALNHSEELGLAKQPVRQAMILDRYGVSLPAITSFAVGKSTLSLVGTDLYLQDEPVAYCLPPLKSALLVPPLIIALCADQLLLLNTAGQVVERLGSGYGVPEKLTALALEGEQLWLLSEQGTYRADLDSLHFEPIERAGLQAPDSMEIDDALRIRLVNAHLGDDVHWERVLLDIHSGRLFGRVGVYVVDAAAIALLLLALSGVWVWLTKPGRWR